MRGRLAAIGAIVLGLGVPLLAAWYTARQRRGGVAVATAASDLLPAPRSAAGGPPRLLLDERPRGAFAALGRFGYRHRRWLPIAALAVVIGLNGWAASGTGVLSQGGWTIPDSVAKRADALLADRFGNQARMLVLFRDPNGQAKSQAFQQQIAQSLARVKADAAVEGILTYQQLQDPAFVSRDGTWALAVAKLKKTDEDSVETSARLAAAIQPPQGVEVITTGVPQVYHELNQKIEHDLLTAELISFPVALIILLIVFGTLIGAALPLVIAGLALTSTFAVIKLLAGVTEMSIYVNNIASMIGIALAIDYSLFMVSRFREELRHHSVEIAVERMMATVGKAVAVSGVAVAVGLSGLTVFEAGALRSMGIGGVVTVVSTLVFALTLLPALLGMLGPRVNRWRVPLPRALRLAEDDPEAADRRQGHGLWGRVASGVMRRPLVIGLPALVLLLAAGSPFLSLQLSTGSNLSDLPNTPARHGFEILRDAFPGGDSDPVAVAVTYAGANLATDGIPAGRAQELAAYVDRLSKVTGVKSVQSVLNPPPGMDAAQYQRLLAMSPSQRPDALAAVGAPQPAQLAGQVATWISQSVARDTTRVEVFSAFLPDSDAGRNLVTQVRAVTGPAGATVLTGGLSSRSLDFIASFDRSVPVAVLIVIAVTALVLLLTFGSLLLPIKAVLMSLISISASFGALVWIFQQGHLSNLLGFEASGTIGAWLPVMMFAILFGLSMDYEVLLLSRIRERYVATGENTRAVAEGLGITGGIITGAALIMVAVFSAFALSSIVFIKAIGFAMALAVLIDATIVRGILVPAFMRVMGRANWWAPRWMQRAVARLGLYEDPLVQVPVTDAAPVPGPLAGPPEVATAR